MPVILYKGNEQRWLNHDTPLHDITALLEPYPVKEMNAYPIDKRIKNPRANDADLLTPTGPLVIPEIEMNYSTSFKLVGKGHDKRDDSWKTSLGDQAKKDN